VRFLLLMALDRRGLLAEVLDMTCKSIYVICSVLFVDYIKSCYHKCTLFIVCYLIQLILKIVQRVLNYVSSSSGTQLFITPATDVRYSLKYIC
jgi:hypothetical protein